MKKCAAIDIGSNAIRFALGSLNHKGELEISKRMRVPLRLGREAFYSGAFSDETIEYACKVFQEFAVMLEDYGVEEYLALATSAYRNAANSGELGKRVKQASHIEIQMIDGLEEAKLIQQAVGFFFPFEGENVILLDIGGGSLEISNTLEGDKFLTQSFKLGTVRVLAKEAEFPSNSFEDLFGKEIKKAQRFIETLVSSTKYKVVGTGGNFRRFIKLKKSVLGKKSDSIRPQELEEVLAILESTPYLERVKRYHLRSDRADVIIPAMQVVLECLKTTRAHKIYAPDTGLLHGIFFKLLPQEIKKIKSID